MISECYWGWCHAHGDRKKKHSKPNLLFKTLSLEKSNSRVLFDLN